MLIFQIILEEEKKKEEETLKSNGESDDEKKKQLEDEEEPFDLGQMNNDMLKCVLEKVGHIQCFLLFMVLDREFIKFA